MTRKYLQRFFVVAMVGAAALVAAAPTQGHIQVLPAEVAPSDPVLFTVLVPGETASGTSKVEMKVPTDVYPFSFEETPGWKRKLVKKPNGLIDRIVWAGKAAPDGLVRFTFLAGTPEKSGSIRWAAIQTYANGQEARWIGEPDSENPAPTTLVSETAPRMNAGGEGRIAQEATSSAISSEDTNTGDDTDWPLTIAALLGFFFGLSSLVILFINRRNSR
jgi:Uncharacterized protein conserved in bacteria